VSSREQFKSTRIWEIFYLRAKIQPLDFQQKWNPEGFHFCSNLRRWVLLGRGFQSRLLGEGGSKGKGAIFIYIVFDADELALIVCLQA
jgi:hypothetical protein